MKNTIITFLLLYVTIAIHAIQPVHIPELGVIFEKYNVAGSILVYDKNNNEYRGYDPDRWNQGFLPASTFKIPNTLIALETGVITPETVFKWNGEKRRLSFWEEDMDVFKAFRLSNVPVYQDIARSIGVDRMQAYLQLLNYGDMDVRPENIDLFWLEGISEVTSYQQLYFLQKLYNLEFPLQQRNMEAVKDIMVLEETDTYRISAKTGWAVRSGTNIGWFVGYVETGGNVFFFVTNVVDTPQPDLQDFSSIREPLTREILTYLEIL